MRFETTNRRLSFTFLCITPLVAIIAAGVRALRVPGVYQSIGAGLFTAIAASAWVLGLHAVRTDTQGQQRLALAGGFLVAPFALVSLLWVGLSAPPDATPPQNQMRYLVLVIMSIAVTSTPWYVRPTFIVGIPAIPWIMPFLIGVVLLRRAGDQQP